MRLVNADPDPKMTGEEILPGTSNYLVGNDPAKWRTNVASYGKVRYQEVYSGIDLVYYGNQSKLEYDFIVKPGSDPKNIRMTFAGADKLSIDDNGNLILHTQNGDVVQHKPIVYQTPDCSPFLKGDGGICTSIRQDAKDGVVGRYILLANNQVAFEVENYDPAKTLVIDPVLSYSTYLGGSDYDYGSGIAVDASGNAYVTGSTGSANFPTTAGAYQTSLGGSTDAFVAKLNSAGTGLVYSTYLGGNSDDSGSAIAVDFSGNAFVTGYTHSNNFPTTDGAYQTTFGGGPNDAFVTKLNAAGTALVYSTYLGGASHENGSAIAVDFSGNAFVTGYTHSNNFPTTRAYKTTIEGAGTNNDAFVTKLNATGTALVYSTYLGGRTGNGEDIGKGIAVDSSGNAYVTGSTEGYEFPTTAGAYKRTYTGYRNAFVTKLNADGTDLIYSTFLGKNSTHHGTGIAVDSSGSAYVVGYTANATVDSFQTALGGGAWDTFVVKLNSTGSALTYSTYFGGSGNDYGIGIALDASGNAYITGITQSTDFPTTSGAYKTTNGGSNDAFVTKLNATGTALVYSTYLGGNSDDSTYGIAVDASGNAYITGHTVSTNFPTTVGAYKTTGDSNGDAFVVKLSLIAETGASTSSTTVTSSLNPSTSEVSVTFTATVSPSTATGTVTFKDGSTTLGSVTLSGGQATYSTASLSAGTHSITAVYGGDSSFTASTSSVLTQTVNTIAVVKAEMASPANGSTLAATSQTFTWNNTGASEYHILIGSTQGGADIYSLTQGTSTSVTITGLPSDGSTIYLRLWSKINGSFDGNSNDYTYKSFTTPFIGNTGNTGSTGGKIIAYIANYDDNTVSAIDTSTNTVTATIPVGGGPYGTVVNPAGTRAYVTNFGGNTVSVIDTSNNTVTATVPVGAGPRGIAVNPTGSRVYVMNVSTVSVIDTNTNTVVATVTTGGSYSFGLAVNPAGTSVYVTTRRNLAVIDTNTNTVTTTISAGIQPVIVAVKPDGTRVYVSDTAGAISVIDTSTNNVISSINGGGTFGAIAINPAGTRLYAANQSNGISVIDTAINTVIANLTVGVAPFGVSVTPDGSRVYVTNSSSNNVAVIDAASNTVIATVPVGGTPMSLGNFIGNVPSITTTSTATSIRSSTNPSTHGTSVDFTATVSPSSATGQVSFKNGSRTLGTVSLSGGSATYTTSELSPGSISITAVYGGNSSYAGSTSPILTQTVNPGNTIGCAT